MIKQKFKSYRYDIFALATIAISLLISVLYNSNLPGIYLDSVNPDYAGVQILSSNDIGYMWAFSTFNDFPVLPQMYHGAITTITTMLSCLVTGTTSVLQLHIVNACYGFVICSLVYFILKRFCNKKIAIIITFLLATSPSLATIFRVQYYIKLPGAAFILGSLYLTLLIGEEQKTISRNRKIMWSALLAGIAFYSYFHYLFFAPALFGIMLFQTSKNIKIERLKFSLLWVVSYCLGILGYIVGYSNVFFDTKIVWLILIGVLVITIPLIFIIVHEKFKGIVVKIYVGILIVVVLGVATILIFNLRTILDTLAGTINNLNVLGEKMNLTDRIVSVFKFWKSILNSHAAESLIYGSPFTVLPNIYLWILVISTVISVIVSIIKKNNTTSVKLMYVLLIMLASFCAFAVFFASRLNVQHFVPLLPLSFLLLGAEFAVILQNLKKISFKSIAGICACLIVLNFINFGVFQYHLGLSGGRGLFTHQINELSYEATENQRNGMKEIYVFDEWGFFAGFSYLTKNTVPYTSENNIDVIQKYLSEDYTVVICSWDNEKIHEQKNQLKEIYHIECEMEERYTLDGQIAFYMLTLNS